MHPLPRKAGDFDDGADVVNAHAVERAEAGESSDVAAADDHGAPLPTELPPAFQPDDWHGYGLACLNRTCEQGESVEPEDACTPSPQPPPLAPLTELPADSATWLNSLVVRERQGEFVGAGFQLPAVPSFLRATEMQRIGLNINLHALLAAKQREWARANGTAGAVGAGQPEWGVPQRRIKFFGTAGVGKSFVLKGVSFIARRLWQQNEAVLNLAPTGSAGVLNPGGRTWHSVTKEGKVAKKDKRTACVADYPLAPQPLEALRRLTGNQGARVARVVNLDEDGMIAAENLAWIDGRLNEACLSKPLPPDVSFGGVPVVNSVGDHGQLPSGDGGGVHLEPNASRGPIAAKGWDLRRREFEDVLVLNETMRQGPAEAALLERLLAIRAGRATQQHWVDIHARLSSRLSDEERERVRGLRTIDATETWAPATAMNRTRLIELAERTGHPVCYVPAATTGAPPKGDEKEVAQIPASYLGCVGSSIVATKNQLVFFKLNNGARGSVVAHLYAPGAKPPEMPLAVVAEFPEYDGPSLLPAPFSRGREKWIPIPVNFSKDESEKSKGAMRRGLPLRAGYATVIHKLQGTSVGGTKTLQYLFAHVANNISMESKFLGLVYTLLSRMETDADWELAAPFDADRLLYVNKAPGMQSRRNEDRRLQAASDVTVAKYGRELDAAGHALTSRASFISNLQAFDAECDGDEFGSSCWLLRRGDLPDMVGAAVAIASWQDGGAWGQPPASISLARVAGLLEATAGGATPEAWPAGWAGSGLVEWASREYAALSRALWVFDEAGGAASFVLDGDVGFGDLVAAIVGGCARLVAFGDSERSCTLSQMRDVAECWAGAELEWLGVGDIDPSEVPLEEYELQRCGRTGALNVI